MNLAGVMFFGIASALLAVLLGQIKGEYSIYIILAAGIFLFIFILSKMSTVIAAVNQIKSYIHFEDAYINVLIKIVGISYLTQFSADLCRDCGYHSLANQLQIFGKISVLAVSMPVVLSLLETINQVLE
ncbi:MAG: stage III sporulation protein AD [Lachnospiraceae bacterium]|jgi:Stage III sporulation protein AC/AD protein family.|nr:stage III sporulation protein AD [Lachnospiraceae bacterium]MCI8824374.1 stage III sporulation protein AD [Lachnospiraceae bacterium]MCI9369880.1 stage III sporulation protein AD [Lachnospiraceae bacterium]